MPLTTLNTPSSLIQRLQHLPVLLHPCPNMRQTSHWPPQWHLPRILWRLQARLLQRPGLELLHRPTPVENFWLSSRFELVHLVAERFGRWLINGEIFVYDNAVTLSALE